MSRNRVGKRTHVATFQQHSGQLDKAGNPTYGDPLQWSDIVLVWYCEALQVRGAELIRGRQTVANTSIVLYGEKSSVTEVQPKHRCILDGIAYGVTAVLDADGDGREMRIELQKQVG